jgi:hypothetical protein
VAVGLFLHWAQIRFPGKNFRKPAVLAIGLRMGYTGEKGDDSMKKLVTLLLIPAMIGNMPKIRFPDDER